MREENKVTHTWQRQRWDSTQIHLALKSLLNHNGGGGGLWIKNPGREEQSSFYPGPEMPRTPGAQTFNTSLPEQKCLALSVSEGTVHAQGGGVWGKSSPALLTEAL